MDRKDTPKIWPRLAYASDRYNDLVDLIEYQLWGPGTWLEKSGRYDHWPQVNVDKEDEFEDVCRLLTFRDSYMRMRFEREKEAFYQRGGGQDGEYDPYSYDPYDPSTWPEHEQIEWEQQSQA